MKVKAVEGVKVPMENRPHVYIEQQAVEVEDSLYYQRRLADGDLVEVNEPEGKAKNKQQTNEVSDEQ